jgi:hypothetical protein
MDISQQNQIITYGVQSANEIGRATPAENCGGFLRHTGGKFGRERIRERKG